MVRGVLPLVVVGALFGGAPRDASAMCAERVAHAPPEGTVPLVGSLFLHREWFEGVGPVPIEWRRGAGTTTVDRISDEVIRIDYAGAEGARLIVNHVPYDLTTRALRLQGVRVIGIDRARGSWSCSSYDELSIATDRPHGAFHARWSYRGHPVDYVAVGDESGGVVLGKVSCGGTTIPPAELAEGGILELFALEPDGSETRMLGPFEVPM